MLSFNTSKYKAVQLINKFTYNYYDPVVLAMLKKRRTRRNMICRMIFFRRDLASTKTEFLYVDL